MGQQRTSARSARHCEGRDRTGTALRRIRETADHILSVDRRTRGHTRAAHSLAAHNLATVPTGQRPAPPKRCPRAPARQQRETSLSSIPRHEQSTAFSPKGCCTGITQHRYACNGPVCIRVGFELKVSDPSPGIGIEWRSLSGRWYAEFDPATERASSRDPGRDVERRRKARGGAGSAFAPDLPLWEPVRGRERLSGANEVRRSLSLVVG